MSIAANSQINKYLIPAFHTYIFTNNTRDKFITGYTENIVRTIKQFHSHEWRQTYLPPEKQDCFLLVFMAHWPTAARAILEDNILANLSEPVLRNKITAFNPLWRHLNIELLQAAT